MDARSDLIDEGTSDQVSKEFEALMKQGFEALMPTIRVSNSLPKNQQWDLFCTSPSFKPTMDSLGNKALDLMAMILQNQGLYRDIKKRDLEEKCELVVEANDKILEKVSTNLDELSGIRRNPNQSPKEVVVSPINSSGSWNRDVTKSAAWREVTLRKSNNAPVVLRNARVTERPQVKFLDKIDNSSTPFEPRIKEKPNSLKPLAILVEALPNEEVCYSHPYEFELERFQERIGSLDLKPRTAVKPRPLEDTPLMMVTEEGQLMDMLEELKTHTEMAVDLEHHSYRSFQGFTCLMQISTREKDYVIDTLSLRHKLYVLNEVFTNPKIVKVFHGAESDIQWLQRDLCLYVVNMFDTFQASLLLSLPKLSLAYLLKTYCNVDANKQFQLYDWRTRPLATDAVKYAREDTHYLLYVFDVLWNRLIEKSGGSSQLLESVLFRSADVCKKRYWKSIYTEESFEKLYRQSKKNFDNRQMYAFKELFAWRDKTAREEDESIGYVLPNHMLLLIAEKLPKEMQGILACCNPIPPLVRQNLVLLHQILLRAREQPLVIRMNSNVNSESRVRPTPQVSVNLEGSLHCPHDLTHTEDFRDDLPTLLSLPETGTDLNANIHLMETQPTLSVFGIFDNSNKSNTKEKEMTNQVHFMSPYQRYRKMVAYLENEEKKSKEDKEKEIMQDTQKLLNECSKEIRRLQQSQDGNSNGPGTVSNEILNISIKEEVENNESSTQKRKRPQDDVNEDNLLARSIKEEMICEEVNFSKKRNYEDPSGDSGGTNVQEVKTEYDDGVQPRKKKKVRSEEVIPMSVGRTVKPTDKKLNDNQTERKRTSDSFKQYDYSQVDYSQYQYSQSSNSAKKGFQDNFKHKGKKKQQNKSFTFARQFSSRGKK